MDKYERSINLLRRYVDGWKKMFDYYCEQIGDKSKPDYVIARYTAKANESFMMFNELNAILNDILSVTKDEDESLFGLIFFFSLIDSREIHSPL